METTEAGRTRWTTGLVEPGWGSRETGRRPGGDHGVGTESQVEPQELVEPGGDHEGRPHGSGSSEHRTGGVVAEVENIHV